jgi:NitT/TauT family transport system ATP-binding protein
MNIAAHARLTGLPIGAESEAYVALDGVSKTYLADCAAVDAVERFSVAIKPREFVSILGPSGCGKSTLLMIVAGLERPTSGHVEIAGRKMTEPRPDIGIMFQDPTLLPWKTVLDNVLFPFAIRGQSTTPHRDAALQLLQRVGLEGFEGKRPAHLSGGMRQRVALCRALITQPDLILMDEPFSALDALTRDEMNVVLTRLWQEYRKTVLFVTHSIREAVFLSDRVLVMTRRPGRLLRDVRIDIPRPRDFAIDETPYFNKLCGELRRLISLAHG